MLNSRWVAYRRFTENRCSKNTLTGYRDNGEWAALTAQERAQNLSNLSHIGMMARFDNILGRDTVRTLVRLSAHAPYVFCHPTLVERIASMLNYFLLHLVGPNKKNFKMHSRVCVRQYSGFDNVISSRGVCRH